MDHNSYNVGSVKRWLKRLAYVAAGAGLLVVLFLLVERLRGEWALNAQMKVLAARGEILSLTAFKPKRPASDENLFIDLLALTNQLAVAASNLEVAPPSLRLAAPGRAVVVASLDEWSHDGKTTNDWQTIGLAIAQAKETLTALETATRKPAYDGGFDYEKGFVDFQLTSVTEVKRACQLLSGSALHALRQGNLAAAHKDLIALVMVTAKQSPEPLMICQMVRQACAAIAFNTTWQSLQADGWSDAQLASLQAAWQQCDFVKDMALAMEVERAMTLDYYRQLRGSRAKLDFVIQQHQKAQEMTDGAYGALPTQGIVLNWLHLPVWQIAWAAQDELAALNQWQFSIERERLARTNGWSALTGDDPTLRKRLSFENKEELGWYDRLRLLFAHETASPADSMIRRALLVQTQQQMAIAALGIERYRLRTGRLPPTIAEMIPEYLTRMPQDFMNGKALIYRLQPRDNDFLLYSVGEDGKDDGGDPTPTADKNYRQIWKGRDAVWPSAASAEEARLAVGKRGRE